MVEIKPSDLEPYENSRIVNCAVCPRPIAWISSISQSGITNLAPFSSFNYVGSRNPRILFNTPIREDRELKDTPQNILDTGEFAVNMVTEDLLKQMDETSAEFSSKESEFDKVGIKSADCELIEPPRVADSPVTMECTHYDTFEIGERLMIIGQVQYYHVSDDILTDGQIDMKKINPVGRLGGPFYTLGKTIDYTRKHETNDPRYPD